MIGHDRQKNNYTTKGEFPFNSAWSSHISMMTEKFALFGRKKGMFKA